MTYSKFLVSSHRNSYLVSVGNKILKISMKSFIVYLSIGVILYSLSSHSSEDDDRQNVANFTTSLGTVEATTSGRTSFSFIFT